MHRAAGALVHLLHPRIVGQQFFLEVFVGHRLAVGRPDPVDLASFEDLFGEGLGIVDPEDGVQPKRRVQLQADQRDDHKVVLVLDQLAESPALGQRASPDAHQEDVGGVHRPARPHIAGHDLQKLPLGALDVPEDA